MPGRGRILLIDDEPPVLLTYSLILQRHGYEITAVATADEARSELKIGAFDVIICDLSIEGERGGFDLLEEAKRQNPRISAILLTGYATEEQGAEAEEKGLALLFKPIGVEELVRVVESGRGGESHGEQRSA